MWQSRFVICLFAVLARLPLRLLHAKGACLGWLVGVISPKTRRTASANLQTAGLRLSPLRVLAENGRAVLELAWVWMRPTDDVMARIEVQGEDSIDAALAQGKGVVLLTPHMGCFEVTAQWIAARFHGGTPITVLYRPPRKTWLAPLIEGKRGRPNLALAPADGSGVRKMLRALKKGEVIGLLPDQVPGKGEGVWADWFGKPAFTMTLPAKLALATGAPVVVGVAIRRRAGRGWTLIWRPFEGVLTGDEVADALTINLSMQGLVALAPEQYWWAYKRYKAPPGASL
jgi:KDO2-lipid IV(A) lauroyltransferase